MKKKLKGLLSLWLAVVLVLGTPTVPILAEGTDHEGHTNVWEELSSSGGVLDGNYYCNGTVVLDSPVSVSTNCSATICLNNWSLSAYGCVNVSGQLTMDNCKDNSGTCSVPFNVESDGILNLERGGIYWFSYSKC